MFGSTHIKVEGGQTGTGGKIMAALFGLVFAGAGLCFFFLIGKSAVLGIQTWTWRKTDCVIMSSRVGDQSQKGPDTSGFYPDVHYRYTFNGQSFDTDKFAQSRSTYEDYGKAARLTAQYPVETHASCYVNPHSPREAVLVRFNFLFLLTLLLPLPFIAIGGGVIYVAWRPKRAVSDQVKPISDRASPARPLWILKVFCATFLGVGLITLWGFFIRPMWKMISAQNWPAVPCLIVSSEVRSNADSEGKTYRVNILYSYEIQGRTYQANAYSFMGGSSSGYEGKQIVVSHYRPGSQASCYVDPADPFDAVLTRGPTTELWFGLIPLVFVLFGAGGLFYTGGSPAPSPDAVNAVLKPKRGRGTAVVGASFICLFWNGIVLVFVTQVVQSWQTGRPEWGLTIFLIPFVVIGLGLVGAVFYFLMALFNPIPRLTISPSTVPLGDNLRIQWTFRCRPGVMKRLTLRLEGHEEATYTRGSNTDTDKNLFAALEIVNTTLDRQIQSGEARVSLPRDLAPTFAARHNKIIWTIRVQGDIAWWPDVRDEFPVTVLPPASQSA